MAPNKDKIRASAQKHLQKGQIDRAIKDFQRLVELDPKDVRTLLKVGDLQTRTGKHSEATETYGRVAQFYSDQGFFLKAVAVYKQILKIDPTLIETNLKLAELYHQLGLISDASNQYRQISQMYEKLGKIEESVDVLRRMVELDPENIASRIKLAEIYAKQGMVEEARNEFRAAASFLTTHHRIDDYIKVAERIIHYDPTDLETTRELANIYVQKGDARRALAKLQVCFKANPRDAETLGLLANAFRELGQVQKTVSVFRELAHLHHDRGDNASYVGVMQKILDLAPDDSEARAAMSSAAAAAPAARPAAAAPAARPAAATYSPPPEPVELEAAEIEVEEEEIEFADDAMVAEEVAPSPQPAAEAVLRILTEVDVYVKYGLKNKALEHVQKVFELDADNVEAHRRRKELLVDAGETSTAVAELWWLARAAHSDGDAEQLQADLQELLSLDPSHREAVQLLAQLGLAPPPVEAAPEEIEVEVEPDIDLGEEELVVEAAADLEYEPSAAAAEIDLDEGYTEASDEIAAALADEPFDLEETSAESAVVSGESTIRQSRQRPSEIMGAHAHGVSTAETSSASGSSAVNLTPPEPAVASEAMTEQRAAPRSPAAVDLDELDELLAGAPRMAEPRPVAEAGQPAAVDKPILQAPIPAGAGPGLEDEVEEIEFFLQQGLEDEAHDALEALLLGHPEHPELLRLKAELQAAQAEPEPEPVQVDEDIPEPETVKIETIDLAAELAQELDAAAEDEDFQVSFADVFDEFKRGVAEQVDDSDHQTHYDLGIAYKEMGLLDDAVREFGLAVRAPDAQIGALTMIGICKLELGRTSDALEHFLQGLNSDAVTAEEALALRFEIGRAYESMGKLGEATKFYEKVHAMDASFRDVTTRLREVKNAGGDSAEVSDELDALLTETAAEKSARGKISYV